MQTESGFDIIYSYIALVPPNKDNQDEPQIQDSLMQLNATSASYFAKIFDKALSECNIKIIFKTDGAQNNDLRSKLIQLASDITDEERSSIAREIACSLSNVTDERSKKGLFLIMIGEKLGTVRIVMSRFKSEDVVVANINDNQLLIDYINQAFSKKSNDYKSVIYENVVSPTAFEHGFAIDKQITEGSLLSSYWLKDFLTSVADINSIQGTRYITNIIKEGIQNSSFDEDTKNEIFCSTLSLENKIDEEVTIGDFLDDFSEPVKSKLYSEYMNEEQSFFETSFVLNRDTFYRNLGSEILTLDSGIKIILPTNKTNLVDISDDPEIEGNQKFVVVGKIINKKFAKRRNPLK